VIGTEQKLLAVAAHIAYVLGGIGFIFVPLALFFWSKNKNDFFVADHAKQALCAQVSIGVLFSATGILIWLIVGVILVPFMIVIALAWCIASFYAAWAALHGKDYRYPLIQPLVSLLD
jgi:hypothetical protein